MRYSILLNIVVDGFILICSVVFCDLVTPNTALWGYLDNTSGWKQSRKKFCIFQLAPPFFYMFPPPPNEFP